MNTLLNGSFCQGFFLGKPDNVCGNIIHTFIFSFKVERLLCLVLCQKYSDALPLDLVIQCKLSIIHEFFTDFTLLLPDFYHTF